MTSKNKGVYRYRVPIRTIRTRQRIQDAVGNTRRTSEERTRPLSVISVDPNHTQVIRKATWISIGGPMVRVE